MSPDTLLGVIFAIMGLVVGFGMAFVEPSPGEPEKLARIWPWVGLYRHRWARIAAAALGFGIALLGIGLTAGTWPI